MGLDFRTDPETLHEIVDDPAALSSRIDTLAALIKARMEKRALTKADWLRLTLAQT